MVEAWMDHHYHYYRNVSPVAEQLTSLVSLRKFDLSDADDLMMWASDERATRFCRLHTYTSREQAIEYISSNVYHQYLRAICVNNRAIGAIEVTSNPGSEGFKAELGYVLAAAYWGQGIATRAVKLVTSTIFKEWPQLERLEALVDVENKASMRVLEKALFTREGTLRKYLDLKGVRRDVVMFSLLSTDPQDDAIIHTPSVEQGTQLHTSFDTKDLVIHVEKEEKLQKLILGLWR